MAWLGWVRALLGVQPLLDHHRRLLFSSWLAGAGVASSFLWDGRGGEREKESGGDGSQHKTYGCGKTISSSPFPNGALRAGRSRCLLYGATVMAMLWEGMASSSRCILWYRKAVV